jgi:hypothetical protein
MKPVPLIVVTATALFTASVWVAFRGASNEPYATFRASDAIVQIGVASALMTLWVIWSILVTVEVRKKRISASWLSALILSALMLLLLYQSPAGYVSDIVHWKVVAR